MSDWDSALDRLPRRGPRPAAPGEREAFYASNPWPAFRHRLDERAERHEVRRHLSWNLWFSGLGLAASAAVALVILWPKPPVPADTSEESGIRMKGGASATLAPVEHPALELRLRGHRDVLASGAVVPATAELVFTVNTGSYDHVVVFGLEPNGTVAPYYPDEEDGRSLLVGSGHGLALPDSVALDGAAGTERFVAVFSSRALGWAEVREAMATKTPIAGTEEVSVWLEARR